MFMKSIQQKFKARFLFLFVFASLISSSSEAYVFRVLGVSGKIMIKTGNQESALRAGYKLELGQTLVLENGYCGLVHSSGKILELKSPGTFQVAELAGKVNGTGKGKVSEKYLDYVMGQLSKQESEEVDKNVRKYMDVPGSVDRSVRGLDSKTTQMVSAKVFAFKTNDVKPVEYTIEWESVPGISTYRIQLKNRFEEVVFSRELTENKIALDFGKILGQTPDSYTLQVTYPSKTSAIDRVYIFKVVGNEDIGLQSEENSPASLMLNGIICEENHLYLDALRYYKAAQNLEPGVGSYGEAFEKLKTKMD